MSPDVNTPGGSDFDAWMAEAHAQEEANQRTEGENVLPAISHIQSVGGKAINLLEHHEKLLSLTPRSIVIDPEHPEESPDLREMERIYGVVPDDVLRALDNDDATYLEGINQGGMLNRFEPTPVERRAYSPEYESVKQQIITDVLGTSGRPGQYVVRGLFDPEGRMRAYLSFRLPPVLATEHEEFLAYSEKRGAYVDYLQKVLELRDEDLGASPSSLGRDRFMEYKKSWNRQKTQSELGSMWEFDTINVEAGWRGAGLLMVKDVLQYIDGTFQDSSSMTAFAYRYNGLRVEDASGHSPVRGENKKSSGFLETRLGFAQMANKFNPAEIAAREMSDGVCHIYHPEWTYLWCRNSKMKSQLAYWLHKQGLES